MAERGQFHLAKGGQFAWVFHVSNVASPCDIKRMVVLFSVK